MTDRIQAALQRIGSLFGARAPIVAAARDDAALGAFVETAFRRVLRRAPTEAELAHYIEVTAVRGAGGVLDLLFDSGEYLHRNQVDDRSEFYAGHFYSPVVNPEELRASGYRVDRRAEERTVTGVDLRPEAQAAFWARSLPLIADPPFPLRETEGARYYAGNDLYSWGDSSMLLAMMAEARPQRIVEVGSGFSSACMLDIADRLELSTRFTFIEPYPERLYGLLGEKDRARCTVVEAFVQTADLALFDALEANDILFIDSTHVSKAGSDVNFELFEVLPRLKPGVIVHVHDTFWPFEYPDAWIFESRRSWNELYILRAFLMHNRTFEVVFFNDYFRARHPALAAKAAKFCENPGGGLWLRKTAAA